MIEPRQSFHLLRRDSSSLAGAGLDLTLSERLNAENTGLPETPIHPSLEYEIFVEAPTEEIPRVLAERRAAPRDPKTDVKLLISFFFLVVFGTGNSIGTKLQAIPMYNYPNFLNLFVNIMYIPICFAYIIPVARFGWFNNAISPEQTAKPKFPFAVMGALDCLATSMQIFSSVYLPGPLLVLLPQAAIPISILFSRYIINEQFRWTQYAGACVVVIGICLVLEPLFTNRRSHEFYCEAIDIDNDCTICQVELSRDSCLAHRRTPDDFWTTVNLNLLEDRRLDSDQMNPTNSLCQWLPFENASREGEILTFVWALVMIGSAVPMTLSTMYKEVKMGGAEEMDPVYLNGWIAVFQFLFSLPLTIPAGMFFSPPIQPQDVLQNLLDGLSCYLGKASISTGCHPDEMCSSHAAWFVNLSLFMNVGFTYCMLYVLKYGNTALLFLALTVMVPLGNLAFSLPIMPQSADLHLSDVIGLVVIVCGLILYRFVDAPEDSPAAFERECEYRPLLKQSNHRESAGTGEDGRGALPVLDEDALVVPVIPANNHVLGGRIILTGEV